MVLRENAHVIEIFSFKKPRSDDAVAHVEQDMVPCRGTEQFIDDLLEYLCYFIERLSRYDELSFSTFRFFSFFRLEASHCEPVAVYGYYGEFPILILEQRSRKHRPVFVSAHREYRLPYHILEQSLAYPYAVLLFYRRKRRESLSIESPYLKPGVFALYYNVIVLSNFDKDFGIRESPDYFTKHPCIEDDRTLFPHISLNITFYSNFKVIRREL